MKQYFTYWILPLLVIIPLMIMYFSGVHWLVEIVCPSINWEFGALENIQLLILLLIFGISAIGIKRKRWSLEKIAFGFLTLFSIFVFLEEIDYGAHYLQYFKGHKDTVVYKLTGSRNLHNEGNNAKIFKRSVYGIMALAFLIAPLFKGKLKSPLLEYLVPKKMIILTAVTAIFVDLIPRFLIISGFCKDGGLGVNIGEFSEIMVYYIFFLYLREIVFEKPTHERLAFV